jgi:hypothetical protein
MKYPLFFIAGLVAILAVLVLLYFKAPKFHAWVNGKFHKVKKPETTASTGQDKINKLAKLFVHQPTSGEIYKPINGTAAAYLCNGCGGVLQPTNWPKFMACEKCHKVQQKIN